MESTGTNAGISAPLRTDGGCNNCDMRERDNRRTKTVYVGRDGWPVEGFTNKPIKTFLRRFILTKKKMNYGEWLDQGGCKIYFN
jgi:hypothetical protein